MFHQVRLILIVIFSILVLGCSGNSSSTTDIPNTSLNRFSGVVNNGYVSNMAISLTPINKFGQFSLDENGAFEGASGFSNNTGRYSFTLENDSAGSYLFVASSIVDGEVSRTSCQISTGCSVKGEVVPFGGMFDIDEPLSWIAAIESVSEAQFVVINPITEMARVYGYTAYVNESDSNVTSEGTVPVEGYYSNYNIAKSNTQIASLMGLSDILSIEPANLYLLHNLNASTPLVLRESIRYGALLAAWQKLSIEFDNTKADQEAQFQSEVITSFIAYEGQLYQADSPNEDVLTLKDWLLTALQVLEGARDYHISQGRTVSESVMTVLAEFQAEIATLDPGQLTQAEFNIPVGYLKDYSDAVSKTKATINYLSDLPNQFATSEYRNGVSELYELIKEQGALSSQEFDEIFQDLLLLREYYLSCVAGLCSASNKWNSYTTVINDKKEMLISGTPGGEVKVSQEILKERPEEEAKLDGDEDTTRIHDLLISGTFFSGNLQLKLEDQETSDPEHPIYNAIRFTYSKEFSEIPQIPALLAGGSGLTEDEERVPNSIEMTFPRFTLTNTALKNTDQELTIEGAATILLTAAIDFYDTKEGLSDLEKTGKRFNIANFTLSVAIEGLSHGVIQLNGEEVNLQNRFLLSFNAGASSAVATEDNLFAYYPDERYPSFDDFFVARKGFEVGSSFEGPIAFTKKGIMNFPALNSDGSEIENQETVVEYLEVDFVIGGAVRYVVYPKLMGDEKYFGLRCIIAPEDELLIVDPSYTVTETDEKGVEFERSLLSCTERDRYEGGATLVNYLNEVYRANRDLISSYGLPGRGRYRIDFPMVTNVVDGVDVDTLADLPTAISPVGGTLEDEIVLGVNNLRMQVVPEVLDSGNSGYQPTSAIDLSMTWPRHDLIDVSLFFAYDAEQIFKYSDGSGLPYLAVGSNVESTAIAYRVDETGNEVGNVTMSWSGVYFQDGMAGSEHLFQKTNNADLSESVLMEVGSSVNYEPYSKKEIDENAAKTPAVINEEKCGFFDRGNETEVGEDCEAIAYLNFRGLVTGTVREERDGVYVVRYIDGSWQVLGN